MKIQAADATERQIDWLVSVCEGNNAEIARMSATHKGPKLKLVHATYSVYLDGEPYRPTTNPDQGHPILERAGIAVRKHSSGIWYAMLSTDLGNSEAARWNKDKRGERYGTHSYQIHRVQCRFEGSTMLIAGLRCFIASELGVEVDVPAELA